MRDLVGLLGLEGADTLANFGLKVEVGTAEGAPVVVVIVGAGFREEWTRCDGGGNGRRKTPSSVVSALVLR